MALSNIKGFKLIDKHGNAEETSNYIPVYWYSLTNHYGYKIDFIYYEPQNNIHQLTPSGINNK